ncbi:hypothetical protein C0992_012348 [Termitomyces sp. T32_za158]|nr:hypothetical protein C0992_012348 [Termitomyces sp. T32_za158]
MDPTQAAKQMAALSAASQARIANTRPTPFVNPQSGTNSAPSLGGTNLPGYLSSNYDLSSTSSTQQNTFQMPNNLPPSTSPSLVDPISQSLPRANPPTNSANFLQRRQGFLNGLANVMASMGTPLPPALTGFPSPNFDPSSSKWKNLELSSEIGTIRIAGRDVGLFQLWGAVIQSGGGQAKRARQANSQGSVDFLGSSRLPSGLAPAQIQRLAQSTSAPADGSSSFTPSTVQRPESVPPTEATPDTSYAHLGGVLNDLQSNNNLSDGNVLDQEIQGIKRKVEYDDRDGKRAKQKIGKSSSSSQSNLSLIWRRVGTPF